MNKRKKVQQLTNKINDIVMDSMIITTITISLTNLSFTNQLSILLENNDEKRIPKLINESINGHSEFLDIFASMPENEFMQLFNNHKFEIIDAYTDHNHRLLDNEEKLIVNGMKNAYSKYQYLNEQLYKLIND